MEKETLEKLEDSSSSSDTNNDSKRENWSRKTDYMLSMLGYAVGLGNLWRFPYLCMRNGGGAFLIPFLFFLIVVGLPLYFLETALGQFTGKSTLLAWEVCPLFKGIGLGMVIVIGIVGIYYNTIIAWTLYYIGNSFLSPLPWVHCENRWNTKLCIADRTTDGYTGNSSLGNSTFGIVENSNATLFPNPNVTLFQNLTNLNNTDNVTKHVMEITSEEEFWQYNVLQMSGGLSNIGGLSWHLVASSCGAWLMVYFCLIKGVKSVGKVVYVTALMPYVLLAVLLVRGLTLPGSADGIIFYLKPDFDKLLQPQVWVEAALQVFYSLGPAWGPLITMSSYNKFNNNCFRDAILLTFASEGTSIYGGFVVFSILGFMANKANLPISEVVKSGPGLGFIAYPEALAQLPLPNLWAVLFFVMLLTVGLDSQFAHVEAVVTAFTDTFPGLRKRRALFTAAICVVGFLLGLMICTQGGIYIFQLVDWYTASFALPLFGLLECIIFGWIYGAEMYSRDIKMMLGRDVPVIIRICWCLVTPFFLVMILVFTIITYKPPTYGSYHYPPYANAIGWFLALVSVLIPLPLFMYFAISKAEGNTLLKKLRMSIRPSTRWEPASDVITKAYKYEDRQYQGTSWENFKLNILGKRR